MSRLKKSLFFSISEKYLVFLIQFISTIFIARLLTPTELGIFSVASLIISFSHIFRDLGISNYVIQEKNLTITRLKTAQTMLYATSWTLALLVWISSNYLSHFYNEPKINDILLILSINFVILPFGALDSAVLRREMLFDRIFKINISAAIAQTISAITLCYSGYGSLGLAWAGVIGNVTTITLTLYFSSLKLSFKPSLDDWRHVLGTGGRYSAASVLWETGVSGPELISGKMMGMEYAGYLGRAQGIVSLAYRTIMEGLSPVLMPHFAEIHRNNQDVGKQFLISIENLAVITFPFFLSMIIAMDTLISVLYGEQWRASVIPAQIICAGMFFLTIATTAGAAVAGMGEAKYSLRFQLVAQPAKLLFVLIGCYFSLIHIAAGMAMGEILLSVYIITTLKRLANFYWISFFEAMKKPSFIALLTASSCYLFRIASHDLNPLSISVGCIISSAIAWLASLHILRHPMCNEIYTLIKK